jgi:hypothetical protein
MDSRHACQAPNLCQIGVLKWRSSIFGVGILGAGVVGVAILEAVSEIVFVGRGFSRDIQRPEKRGL